MSRSATIGVCAALLGLLFTSRAYSLDRSLQISQYGHSAWRLADGLFPGIPYFVSQTGDGYLWIGTSAGLLRFDGVRFTNFAEIDGAQALPSNALTALLGAEDRTLWIGTRAGLSRWSDGTLINMEYPADLVPAKIAPSSGGTVWIANIDRTKNRKMGAPLCLVGTSSYRCFSKDEGLTYEGSDFSLIGLASDLDGSLLLGTASSVLRWRPGGTTTSYELPGSKPGGPPIVVAIARDPGAFFWVGAQDNGSVKGLMQLKADVLSPARIGALDGANISVNSLLMDRDHALWVGVEKHGLWHVANDRVDHYTSSEGLTGDTVTDIFEDREGNVWVATTNGLDMFRALSVVSIGKREGLSEDHVDTIMGSRDDELWATAGSTLGIISRSGVRSIGTKDGVPGDQFTTLFEDSSGTVWAGMDNHLYIVKGHRFSEVKRDDGRPIGRVVSMAQDIDESVLALTGVPQQRIFRFRDTRVVDEGFLPDAPVARTFAAGASGIWVGLVTGDFAKYEDHAIKNVVTFDHSPESFIQRMTVEPDGAVYGSTRIGLAAWKDGKKQMLTRRSGLPCAYLYSHIFDERGDLWLFAECGLMHVARDQVEAWWQDSAHVVALQYFDALDGAHSGFVPFVASARTMDGRLWFTNSAAVLTIDPNHIPANGVLPKVIVERVTANGKAYQAADGVTLGPLLRHLQIDYTATSLSIPQRVKFRYALEGKDDQPTEAGTRRQAFYNDLDPGSYTFRVWACNSDGVWNPASAALRFFVEPAWYQTAAFHLATVLLGLAALCAAYILRVEQIKRAMNLRFRERMEERNRIARDLHDTLLQTIQGSKLIADGVLLERGDDERPRWALKKLSLWLERAVEEVRAAVDALHVPREERDDLGEALLRAARESAGVQLMDISLSTTGIETEFDPTLRTEIYRIGYEAIRNASAHSHAAKLAIQLSYGKNFELLVVDDGCGMDEQRQAEGRLGHFGLRGMRERASRIGASLTIESAVGMGTRVRLHLPARR